MNLWLTLLYFKVVLPRGGKVTDPVYLLMLSKLDISKKMLYILITY